MALRKTTRSVLFYKGMSDDTERFLAKSPAVDYTENLYEERDGVYSKRPGFESLGGPVGTTGDPFILHGVKNSLYTLDNEKGYAYQDGSWGEVENLGDVRVKGLRVNAMTQPAAGACDFCMVKYTIQGNTFYCVAFTVRTSLTNHRVIVQGYGSDGTFRGEQRIQGAHGPRLVNGGLGAVRVFYQSGTAIYRRNYGASTNEWFGSAVSIASNRENTGAWCTNGRNCRLGFAEHSYEHYNAPYHVAYDDSLSQGVLLSKNRTTGRLELLELDVNGLGTGSALTITAPDYLASPLAVAVRPNGGQCAVLYTDRAPLSAFPTMPQRLRCAFIGLPLTLAPYTPYILEEQDAEFNSIGSVPFEYWDRFFGHGSVCYSDDGIRALAIYHSAPDVYQTFGRTEGGSATVPASSSCKYAELYSATATATGFVGEIFGHRLASNVVSDGSRYYTTFQQWSGWTPANRTVTDDVNRELRNTIIPPQSKPVSTVLAELLNGNSLSVCAVIGPNNSRRTDPTSDETTVQLPSLILDDDGFHIINREILEQEDFIYYVGNAAGSINTEGISSLSRPEARASCITIGDAQDDAVSASLGNAAIVSTATPLWFTGTTMSEAYVFDRPEITGLVAETTGQVQVFWEKTYVDPPQPTEIDDWRRFQVVVGYTDSGGNIHRSAPSSVLWVAKLNETSDDKTATFYFTPPLSVFSDRRDYFAELYASNFSSDPLKLVGSQPIVVDQYASWLSFGIRFTVYAEAVLAEKFLPARTSENIYTTGGELAPIPWPSIKHMAVASRRLWMISKQYPGSVFYSKLFEENVPPEFASELIIPLGEERDLQAIGVLDDKAVVFEENDIHIIYGEGPDNRGRGQDFAVEYLMTGSIGCDQPKSVVETPVGLMFYNSLSGFHMLDRNRQVQFVGGGVSDLADDIVVHAATVNPRSSEVRFLVSAANPVDSDGPSPGTTLVDRPPTPWFGNSLPANACLSFNYESGIWALFTNYAGSASTLYQGRYTKALTVDSEWEIWKESGDSWRDPAGENATLLRSHWIEIGEQIQNYERVWKIHCLGRYLSSLQDLGGGVYEAGDVRVRVWYDYEKDYTQEETFRFQDFAYDPFVEPKRRTERFQFTLEPSRGRCQSIKLEFAEVNSVDNGEGLTYGLGRGFEIVAADFEIGLYEPSSTRLVQQGVRR